MKINVTDGQ